MVPYAKYIMQLELNIMQLKLALSLPLSPVAEKEVSEASFCSDEGSSLSSNEFAGSSGSTSSGSTVITENTKARRRRLVEGPPDSKEAKDVSCS